MNEFKYIADISEECLNSAVVIPCRNEQGYPTILIKNDSKKRNSGFYSTDNLSIKTDKVLMKGDAEYFFHVIESKKNDGFSIQQFQIIYEYIFAKIVSPISAALLYTLVASLEDYFRQTPDPNRKQLQIGVFGELLSLKFLHDAGYSDILEKYHDDFFLKHDIEISPSLRVEVKTAVGEKRIHHFKHDQIHREDVDVYVVSVLLEPSQEGLSLFDLFSEVIGLTEDPDKSFALRKLMSKCGVSPEDKGLTFSENLAYSRIKIFHANSLPQLEGVVPSGVSAVEYDVDCSLTENVNVNEAVKAWTSVN